MNVDNPGPYHLNDVVQLTAVADPGWGFSAWSGDLIGSENPKSITIEGEKAVSATFGVLLPQILSSRLVFYAKISNL